MKYPVYCIKWTESESGWGFRPDGYSYHLTVSDSEKFIKDHWDSMPDDAPSEYSYPDGSMIVDLEEEDYKKVTDSECGIRSYQKLHI